MPQSDGSSTTDRVAVVALVVSLVALIATTGQVLQQYFATADGYRRCQVSVMGAWGKKTRLRWRWRQFRFETLYSTPEIFITHISYPICSPEFLVGMNDVETNILWRAPDQDNHGRFATENRPNGDLVSWLELLSRMHDSTQRSLSPEKSQEDVRREIQLNDVRQASYFDARRVPAIVIVERSWDFQPPDVSRPLAKATLSTIAIMARRMGMRWKDFRPEDGIMRAEGNGHVLTSTIVRTLGLVMQYNHHGHTGSVFLNSSYTKKRRLASSVIGSSTHTNEEIYIPTRESDSLGAGVVYGDGRLSLPDFIVSTQDDIIVALDLLSPGNNSGSESKNIGGNLGGILKEILRFEPTFTLPVGDLVAFIMRPICLANHRQNLSLVQIPAPSDNVGGVTTSIYGRLAFHRELREYIKHRDRSGISFVTQASAEPLSFSVSWVSAQFEQLLAEAEETHLPDSLDEEVHWWIVRRRTKLVKFALKVVKECTEYFAGLMSDIPQFRYPAFLASHFRYCVFEFRGQDIFSERGKSERLMMGHFQYSTGHQVELYFARLPLLVKYWKEQGWDNEEQIINVWTVMLLRAFCWGICHFFVPGERVPIRYYGSQLPIWLS